MFMIEWVWYRDKELNTKSASADFIMGEQPIPDRYAALEPLLRRKHRKLTLRRPYLHL